QQQQQQQQRRRREEEGGDDDDRAGFLLFVVVSRTGRHNSSTIRRRPIFPAAAAAATSNRRAHWRRQDQQQGHLPVTKTLAIVGSRAWMARQETKVPRRQQTKVSGPFMLPTRPQPTSSSSRGGRGFGLWESLLEGKTA
ncbi:unnamed protein product, partial [Ectocarpus sp. 12 AP-2014]